MRNKIDPSCSQFADQFVGKFGVAYNVLVVAEFLMCVFSFVCVYDSHLCFVNCVLFACISRSCVVFRILYGAVLSEQIGGQQCRHNAHWNQFGGPAMPPQ